MEYKIVNLGKFIIFHKGESFGDFSVFLAWILIIFKFRNLLYAKLSNFDRYVAHWKAYPATSMSAYAEWGTYPSLCFIISIQVYKLKPILKHWNLLFYTNKCLFSSKKYYWRENAKKIINKCFPSQNTLFNKGNCQNIGF